MPTPVLSPGHDLELSIDYEELDPVTALRGPMLLGAVTAMIVGVPKGLEPSPAATAADPSLAVPCTDVGNGRRLATFAGDVMPESLIDPLFGSPVPDGIFERDTFTRADSVLLPGNTEIQLQTPTTLGIWGIRSSKLYSVSGSAPDGFREIHWDAGRTRYELSFKVATLGAPAVFGAHVRYISTFQTYAVQAVAGTLVLYLLTTPPAATPIVGIPYTPAVGDCIRVVSNLEQIIVYVNNVEKLKANGLQMYPASTLAGISVRDSAHDFDDMTLTALPVMEPWVVFQAVGGGRHSVRCRYERQRVTVPR